MSHQTQFNRTLDRLYERRTGKLRRLLIRKPGPLLNLTKKKRESRIRELEEIASKALAKKMTKKGFKTLVVRKKAWRTKRWGTDKKQKIFRAWVRKKISPRRGKIYVFWKNRELTFIWLGSSSSSSAYRNFMGTQLLVQKVYPTNQLILEFWVNRFIHLRLSRRSPFGPPVCYRVIRIDAY
jgi:hypothetical protein